MQIDDIHRCNLANGHIRGAEAVTVTSNIYIGVAGWNVPKASADSFPAQGSHLQRYAARFRRVEINSSFYRPHRTSTYERWAATVPEDFSFTVKIPKAITHESRLADAAQRFARFLSEVRGLGTKLGALLVQLPPSLRFDNSVVGDFFAMLREYFSGRVACEPRHLSWFKPAAEQILKRYVVAYVAADPIVARMPQDVPTTYHRLHGSPDMYYSAYSEEYLHALAERLKRDAHSGKCWCIFDNTALGHATENALQLLDILQ